MPPDSSPNSDEHQSNCSASPRSLARESTGNADKPDAPSPTYPLADALFKAIGEQLDAGESEPGFFSEVAELLWTGNFDMACPGGPVSRPYASKARLECMLTTAAEIRKRYQVRLHNFGDIQDVDLERSLDNAETAKLHNAWMNDVGAWMSPDCLQQYNDLSQEADELDKGKGKGSAGKSAKGVEKGSAGKPIWQIPRAQATS